MSNPDGLVMRRARFYELRPHFSALGRLEVGGVTMPEGLSVEELVSWVARNFNHDVAFEVFGDSRAEVTFIVPRGQGVQESLDVVIQVRRSWRDAFLEVLRKELLATSAWRRAHADESDRLGDFAGVGPGKLMELGCRMGMHPLLAARKVPGGLLYRRCACGEKEQLAA